MNSAEDFVRNDLPVLSIDGATVTDISYTRFDIHHCRPVERREVGDTTMLIPGVTTTQIIFQGCTDCPRYYDGKTAKIYYRGRTYEGTIVYVSKNLETGRCEVCFVGGEGTTR